ncbi:hypothetical protein LC082_13845 [Microbacterium esteraromaticum]|uniref:hypothetical protein n=1 Tax=Microbacterium esteraromaticum TaxID=57043 RepID=UPI001CD42FE1|nr:hypothetical protein [Microbacterium esteraromaticum]MCA1307980.1 hypothetical protein [Microbacterium esteraromaticum]
MIMGIDHGTITDPQFKAEMDYAAKRYVARAVGEMLAEAPTFTASELHPALVTMAEQARPAVGWVLVTACRAPPQQAGGQCLPGPCPAL